MVHTQSAALVAYKQQPLLELCMVCERVKALKPVWKAE